MRTLICSMLFLVTACSTPRLDLGVEYKAKAEQFFRGVYGCNASAIDELASDDIALSYPIFQQIYNTPTIRGLEAVKNFSKRFCSRWADAKITIHDSIAENNQVMLLWSFQARNVGAIGGNDAPTNEVHGWGGISYFHFDESGKIVSEVGEESDPGPHARQATIPGE